MIKKYKPHILLLTFYLLFPLTSYCQKEAYNWFFGNQAGLTWNTTRTVNAIGQTGIPNANLEGLPTDVGGSSIITQEGCFSLSDSNGNLLFYSDGKTIWNKNHTIMQNGSGLTGDDTSAQSGIIMPFPGSSDKYIAITINYNWFNKLSYSLIDMTLDNGLGAVVPDKKNVLLTGGLGGIGEAVSAIRHANGKDFWIIAPGRGSLSYMNAWLVTEAGVETTVAKTTPIPMVNHQSSTGYLKFTPDGKYFVWPSHSSTQLLYGAFDANEGTFSDVKELAVRAYGAEFSNSGKYLFTEQASANSTLTVYDFETLIETGQIIKKELNRTDGSVQGGALQMGPDGRIYSVAYQRSYLFVLDNPEEFDNLRLYQLPNDFLGPSPASCRIGFPSFSASWFGAQGDESICMGMPSSYSVSIKGILDASYVVWNFGDGTPEIKDTLTSGNETITKSHTFKSPKTYTIKVSVYDSADNLIERRKLYTKVYRCSMPINHNLTNARF